MLSVSLKRVYLRNKAYKSFLKLQRYAEYPGRVITSCSYLHRADEVAHAVAHRRVDGVLGDVAAHAVVVVVAFLVAQAPSEALHLVGRLPRAADHLPDAAHRLQPSTSSEFAYADVTRLCAT